LAQVAQSFESMYEQLFVKAYQVAFVILGERAEAEDVAQEAAARAFASWGRVETYSTAWVSRVATNLAIDRVRRRARRGGHNREEVESTRDRDGDARVDLQRALQRLPARQRNAVLLRFVIDLPEAEVARVLRCSVGSVKTHTSRGLQRLRTELGASHD
jgi:RNA polymerase sigma factor (sigma-70 family)